MPFSHIAYFVTLKMESRIQKYGNISKMFVVKYCIVNTIIYL